MPTTSADEVSGIRNHELAPLTIVAHAFMESPAQSCKRAAVPNGPWRYSRYQMMIFLLTADGVRQLTVDLDFEHATFHNQDRLNYRYDAVAAVGVQEADDGHKAFELTLVNDHSIDAEVTGPADNAEIESNDGAISSPTGGGRRRGHRPYRSVNLDRCIERPLGTRRTAPCSCRSPTRTG